jgi:hypothetical protein
MIYIKTTTGQQAFKERAPQLTNHMRTAFILFDGVRDVDAVLQGTTGLGVEPQDIERLLTEGYIEAAVATEAADSPDVGFDVQDKYLEAIHLATSLTSSLGLFGFKLNLAVETVSSMDDLKALLPKIEAACGEKASQKLRRLLS